jgi:mannose-binding lectin 1
MSNNDKDYEMCFRVDNVILPKSGFFGISAATGGLAGKFGRFILNFLVSF